LVPEKETLGSRISEQEAISGAKLGDANCFEALYKLHKRYVYALCLRMTGNTVAAEDLTQEVFLQLFRKLGTFRGDAAFSTWLYRVAVNVVLMRLRKPELEIVPEPLESQPDDGPKREPGAEDGTLTSSVDRIALERSVAALPPGYRMIFLLHDVEGYQHQEIAQMLRCSVGNSKSQLHKARMKLRAVLRMSNTEERERVRPGTELVS
jgi:RNA polymerase sigma-70 factor, ECF subfamily